MVEGETVLAAPVAMVGAVFIYFLSDRLLRAHKEPVCELTDDETRQVAAWLQVPPPIEEIDPSLPPAARSAARKTEGLRQAIAKHELKAVIAGIRRDEHGTLDALHKAID